MENIKYTIYKLIDPITNDIRYIGLTFNDLNQRLKSHCSENSKSHKSNWVQSLRKQGLKPVIESIEDNILSYEEVCDREIYWIEKYKSEGHPLTNMTSGGNKNKKMSDESREKMSIAQIERYKTYKLVLSEDVKEILSLKSKERFKDDKEREKLRISNKRYEDSKTEEQKINDILIQNPKKVYQYDKDMNLISNYPSIKNAERTTGISSSNIAKCCKHKVTFVSGYVWRFEGDLTPPKYKNRKEVLKYDIDMNLLEKYENIRKASLDTKVSDSGIRLCCNNKRSSAGGFIWKYK
jgi:group I intron endonuclease